jgi:purine-cytosine permease-like protein
VYCVLAGVSSSNFDLSTPSVGDEQTKIGNRLTFFSICLSAAITYCGGASDFFVYYPPDTPRWILFSLTVLSLSLSFMFTIVLGAGLASGVSTTPSYAAALERGQGALIVEGFAPLNAFGKFCAVITALGLIANTIPPTYIAGIDFQVLGRYALRIPRFVWNAFGVVVYTVCALAGRNSLAEIFTNFLALMGYWVAIWIAILLEECYIFRRTKGYNWDAWNDREKLPLGIAALIAFLVGWAGAILCMAQVWYIGPIAKEVGKFGADVCLWPFQYDPRISNKGLFRWATTSAFPGPASSILPSDTTNSNALADSMLNILRRFRFLPR